MGSPAAVDCSAASALPLQSSAVTQRPSWDTVDQIIDETWELNPNLDGYVGDLGIARLDTEYHVVSIIGPQSSGKSTLLNALYGTSFDVMSEATGRSQTTKGVHAVVVGSSMIVDVEGCDSRERGDADPDYERKAALFAMAISDLVIINVWDHDMGRHQAAALPLLKVVFEVNLLLFAGHGGRCNLLFVLRDAEPTPDLEQTVRARLEAMWNQMSFPPQVSNHQFGDFFSFHLVAMHAYHEQREEFDQDVITLRQGIGSILGKAAVKVPGDGLASFMRGVWSAIGENRELNIPSERRAVSTFRCEGYAKTAVEQFRAGLPTDVTGDPRLGEGIRDLVVVCLASYATSARRWMQDVAGEQRDIAVAQMKELARPIFARNKDVQADRTAEAFAQWLGEFTDLRNVRDFETMAEAEIGDLVGGFTAFMRESSLEVAFPEAPKSLRQTLRRGQSLAVVSSIDHELRARLRGQFDARAESLRAGLERSAVDEGARSLRLPLEEVLEAAQSDMWEKVQDKVERESDTATSKMMEVLERNFSHVPPRPLDLTAFAVGRAADAAGHAAELMRRRFEEEFEAAKRSGEGYDRGRGRGLSVLALFRRCPLGAGTVLIAPQRAEEIESRFESTIEQIYVDAVRQQEAERVQFNVPWWMWLCYVGFGWRRVLLAYRHPWLALVVIVLCVLLWCAKPMLQARGRVLWQQSQAVVKPFLRQALPTKRKAGPTGASPRRASRDVAIPVKAMSSRRFGRSLRTYSNEDFREYAVTPVATSLDGLPTRYGSPPRIPPARTAE